MEIGGFNNNERKNKYDVNSLMFKNHSSKSSKRLGLSKQNSYQIEIKDEARFENPRTRSNNFLKKTKHGSTTIDTSERFAINLDKDNNTISAATEQQNSNTESKI